MADYVVRAETTPPADLTGTAFSHLDVRILVSDERNGAVLTHVGQTVYTVGGTTHEHHVHPHAEETVIVLSGHGWHRVGDDYYDIGPGDVVFVPAGVPHSAGSGDGDDLIILWVLGGAPSLAKAGYEAVPEKPRAT